VAAGLRATGGPTTPVVIRENRELRALSLEVFDRTFEVTRVLRLLAFIVAFIAVLSALMALQLERSRELGVLRANGMTPGQTWGLVTAQTGVMGAVAGILALPMGLVLAVVMIQVVNRRSFGWTLEMEVGADSWGRRSSWPWPGPSWRGSIPPGDVPDLSRRSPGRSMRLPEVPGCRWRWSSSS
jgi:putative ABC transport system permease protein